MDKANIQTIRKWTYLKKYLHAYTTIVSNHFSQFFYIDVCAGRGRYEGHDGSPLIALNLEFPFTDYVFNEKDSIKLKELEQHVKKLPLRKALTKRRYKQQTRDINISFKNMNAIGYIKNELNTLPDSPCFIFIDPDGIEEIDMDSVSICSMKNKAELFINFSVSGILRNVKNKRCHPLLTRYYGNEDWKKIPNVVNREQLYADLYIKSLRKHFRNIANVKLKNDNNIPLYYLIYTTNNDSGFKIMKDVLKQNDEQSKLNTF